MNFSTEEVVDYLRGGFAAGEFHDLADEEGKGFIAACFEIGDRLGILGEDLIDEGLDGSGVVHGLVVGVFPTIASGSIAGRLRPFHRRRLLRCGR